MDFMRLAASAAAGAALTVSAASAEENRSFDLPKFDRIDISAGVELVAEVGAPQKVEVATTYGDFSDFEIKVRDGVLMATREHSPLRWHKNKSDYKVTVSLRDLRGVEASSGAWGKVENIDSSDFNIDISSGAKLSLAGDCGSCTIDLSSGAKLEAETLSCRVANIDVSSGGHGILSVRDTLMADASSGGHMRISGAPQKVNIDKSSGGSIKIVK